MTPRASGSSAVAPATAMAAAAVSTAQLVMQERESVLRTLATASDVRPPNTTRNYNPKQQEFKSWCDTKGYEEMSRYQVTAEKLHLFLEEQVLHRPSKRPKKNGEAPGTLSESSVKGYVAALVDLYVQQQARGVNSAPHPRHGPVRILLSTRKVQEHSRKRSEYVDRGIGTSLDGYTREQLEDICAYFVQRDNETGLRDRLAFLISHYALLRGDNARRLELADLHHLDLSGEGPSPCFAVVLLLANGKTNQAGRVEYGSFLRNKDANVCPVGCLAMYLFSRFHHSAEPFPDMSRSSLWYDTKVIKSATSLTLPISDDAQCKAFDRAFKACHVTTTAKTHAARKSGAQLAESGGASEASVRRAGRWNQTTMETCYLTRLPRPVLRVHAGFHADGGTYFLRRDVPPPPDLLAQVFPQADAWDTAIETGKTASGEPVEVNIAARAFVRLLIRLRPVLLQDAVLWKKQHPHYYLWSHSLFSSPAFLQYEKELLVVLASPDTTSEDRLRAMAPLIAEQMQSYAAATHSHFDLRTRAIQTDIQNSIKVMMEVYEAQRKQQELQLLALQNALKGIFGFLVASAAGGGSTVSTSTSVDLFSSMFAAPGGPARSTSASPAPSSSSGLSRPASPSQQTRGRVKQLPTQRGTMPGPRPMPSMSQDRGINTVTDLWREFKEGIRGLPSVEEMDQDWGNEWRKDEKDRKHYERRMRIIHKIRSLAVQKKVAESVAVVMLEHARMQLKNKSLSKLSELIQSDADLSYPDLGLNLS
ncbi:hypothetical protein CF326_g3980 [Tilletia indica]|nr:hypothetical protein CF326_g3980 [Tilletia indica]